VEADRSHSRFISYTEEVFKALANAAQFFWRSTAGYRLRPWRSPYLRWRMETYTGKSASTLKLSDFLHLAVSERGQMLRFFTWVGSLDKIASGKRP
jgi:hypothetical protein